MKFMTCDLLHNCRNHLTVQLPSQAAVSSDLGCSRMAGEGATLGPVHLGDLFNGSTISIAPLIAAVCCLVVYKRLLRSGLGTARSAWNTKKRIRAVKALSSYQTCRLCYSIPSVPCWEEEEIENYLRR